MFEKFRRKFVAVLSACAIAVGVCGVWAQAGFAMPEFAVQGADADTEFGGILPSDGLDGGDDSSGEEGGEVTQPSEATITIESKNLSYSDSIYILYAVSYEGFDEGQSEVKMMFWDGAQEAYTVDTAQSIKSAQYYTTVRSKQCIVFYSDGIAAKEMNDVQYCRAYAEVNGEIVYSNVEKCSVVDYVYEKRAEGNATAAQENIFKDMLQYGSSAQILFEYFTENLANATYYTVNVVGGTLEDGFTWGRYAVNSTATIRVDAAPEGKEFAYWSDSLSSFFSTDQEITVTVSANNVYTATFVKQGDGASSPLEDFKYSIIDNSTIMIADYLGSDSYVIIPSNVYGMPVTQIHGNAFNNCDTIETLILPESLTEVSQYSFTGCNSLKYNVVDGIKYLGSASNPYFCMVKPEDTSLTSMKIVEGCKIIAAAQGGLVTTGYRKMTELFIPNTVTHIGERAFYNATSLTSVEIPDSVVWVGPEVFGSCSKLATVKIGNGLKAISDRAFTSCSALTSVELGSSITEIGVNAFSNCSRLAGITFPNGLLTIGERAFMNCSSLTSIVLPESLQSMGRRVFNGCSALQYNVSNSLNYLGTENNPYLFLVAAADTTITEAVISEQCKIIGEYAFESCSRMTSVVIPDSVTTIGAEAFYHCRSLKSVEIPDSVTSIGTATFMMCSQLNTVVIGEGIKDIPESMFIDCTALKSVTFSDTLRSIGASAFANTSLQEIVLPDTVVSIGEGAFEVRDPRETSMGLNRISMGSGLQEIGERAFYGCNLTSITISQDNPYFKLENGCIYTKDGKTLVAGFNVSSSLIIADGVEEIMPYAFAHNQKLVSVEVPGTVTSFGMGVFAECTSLESVVICDGVTMIPENAFIYCESLQSIEIPDSVTTINYYAFGYCTGLQTITLPANLTMLDGSVFAYCSALTEITLPETLTEIQGETFNACSSLKNVVIPSSVKRIWNNAFRDCTSLESVVIPDSVTDLDFYAFEGCTSLKTVTIGAGITVIESSVFAGCEALESVSFGAGVEVISSNAFANCTSLTKIRIPDNLKTLAANAFANCTSLQTIVIGNAAPANMTNAFKGCTALTGFELTEGNTSYSLYNGDLYTYDGTEFIASAGKTEISFKPGLETIAKQAFYNNSSLESVVIPASVKSIGAQAFQGCSALTSVQFEENSELESIGYNAFSGCSKLASITIPAAVSIIDEYVFNNCRALTSITISEGVKEIGNRAFYGCNGLTSISFATGSTLETIGEYAFASCSKLSSIELPETVTTIGRYAFQSCSALTEIYLSINVTSVGDYAFRSCSKLTVYCEATSKPSGWSSMWNSGVKTVEWGA